MTSTKLLDALFGPARSRPGTSRWLSVPLRVLGPGSIPLAVAMFFVTLYSDFSDLYITNQLALPFAIIAAVLVIVAGYLPELALLAILVVWWVAIASGLGPLLVFLLTYFVIALGIGWKYGWFLASTLLATGFAVFWALPYAVESYAAGPIRIGIGLLIVLVLLMDAYLLWRRFQDQSAQLAQVRQDAEEQRGQRRHLEERNRIAREMHDVVAHHMSMIAVKASTAEYRLAYLDDDARGEFRGIADSARESLTEMRRILSVVRTETEPADREPQPGIESVDALCQSAVDAGVEVTAAIADNLPELPDAVSLTAYRIVQEALSNVVRHAQGAAATIELYQEGQWLAVVVMNSAAHVRVGDTGREHASDGDSSGMGLAGMRERVELLHGELLAEPLGASGFLVKARLPLEIVEDG